MFILEPHFVLLVSFLGCCCTVGELLSSCAYSFSSGDLCGLLVILVDLRGGVGSSGGSSPGFGSFFFPLFLLSLDG